MRQVTTVFSYTLKEAARKKAFIVSTVIIMVMVLGLCLAPRIISAVKGSGGEKETGTAGTENSSEQIAVDEDAPVCYLIDQTGIFEKNLDSLRKIYMDRNFKIASKEEEEGIRAEIRENENNALISIEEKDGAPFIHVVNANFMKGISAQKISDECNKIWQKNVLEESGVDSRTIAESTLSLPYTEESVGDMDVTGYILGLAVVFIMFFAVYYYGYGVAMSVASEKTSRVMETLVVSAKPSRILIGKCLAMGVLGLIQMVVIIAFAVICYTVFVPANFNIGGVAISFSSITPFTVFILLVYFILGYALYAVMNSVCGAAVSKVEDLNSAMMPVMFISLGSFYLGYFTAIAGGGSSGLAKFAMYLPFSSPFSVPFTLLTGGMKTGDLLVSMGLLLLFIIVIAAVSIRVYSASVLHYGNKLKMKELLRMR